MSINVDLLVSMTNNGIYFIYKLNYYALQCYIQILFTQLLKASLKQPFLKGNEVSCFMDYGFTLRKYMTTKIFCIKYENYPCYVLII